jgi:hypothetical protein
MQAQNDNTLDNGNVLSSTTLKSGGRVLTAFRIPDHYSSFLKIVPAPVDRHWMDFTTRGWANRCLPLRVANQAGWHILNNFDFEAEWGGKDELASVRISFKSGNSSQFVKSSFGFGILTWYLPYVFRTPPGYNLLVRGPANYFKDGIAPLDGLVETDWAVAPFSVNWRFTRPFHKVKFERDEPICAIVPERRGELESFAPEVRNLDGELLAEFRQWLESRQRLVLEKERHGYGRQYEPHYTRGETVTGNKAPEHQTKLALAEFVEREVAPAVLESVDLKSAPARGKTVDTGGMGRWLGRYFRSRSAK